MPDNTQDASPETPEVSTPAPVVQEAEMPQIPEEKTEKPHVGLAESALEASHSTVLPLSPIGGDAEKNVGNKSEKKSGGRHGLRRGASGKKGKNNGASASVGLIENPNQFTETLSGTGPKPREHRRERSEEQPSNAPEAAKSETADVAEKIEEARQGGEWRIREKREKNFRHPQSNAGVARPKLIIEPAPIPVQEEEPSFWQKLKARIFAFFKISKKKKKHNRGKKHGGKFRGDRPQGKKDFRNHGRDGKKNFNRHRNSGFRGNNGNHRQRPQNNKSDAA